MSKHTESFAGQLKQFIKCLWLSVAPLDLPIETEFEPVLALVGLATLLEIVPCVDVAPLEIWLTAPGKQRFVLTCQFLERRVRVVREIFLQVYRAKSVSIVHALFLFILIARAHVALVGGIQVVAILHAEPRHW